MSALQGAYGELVATPIPHSASIKRALNRRLPLALAEPKAGPMAAYRSLARRVADAVAGRAGAVVAAGELAHVGA